MNERILVVDDEEPVLRMVSTWLQSQAYSVETAPSAEKALQVMKHSAFDLILTDLKMPGTTGVELAEELLRQDRDRPVIIMTAYADVESARQALHAGVYEYLVKPMSLDDLGAAIRRGLSHRKLVLENRAYQQNLEQKVAERTAELRSRLTELEARDRLLEHLLFFQDPAETLGLALDLAVSLTESDVGVLYVGQNSDLAAVAAAVGLTSPRVCVDQRTLCDLKLAQSPGTREALRTALSSRDCVWSAEPGPERQALGISCFCVAPLVRGKEILGFLEVGVKAGKPLCSEQVPRKLRGFSKYVSLAVVDSRLHQELPSWDRNLDEMLKVAQSWSA